MKEYKDMTLQEVVDENVGYEIIAIGKGDFRNQAFQSAIRVLEWKKAQDSKDKVAQIPVKVNRVKYTVDRNLYDCHPETCSCDRWAIYQGADKFATLYDKRTAEKIIEALNK